MMKFNHVSYEIWDLESHEVLVDNLTFDDAAEYCQAYEDFFGAPVMVVAVDNVVIIDDVTIAQQYKNAYMEAIYEMGNVL